MKIVGTKLDDSDYEKFADFCLKDEMTKSEVLRDLIKKYCEACADGEEMDAKTPTSPKIIVNPEPNPVVILKILDDDGNVIYERKQQTKN